MVTMTYRPAVNLQNFTEVFELNTNYVSGGPNTTPSNFAFAFSNANTNTTFTTPNSHIVTGGASGEGFCQLSGGCNNNNNIVWINYNMYCGALNTEGSACPVQPGIFAIVNNSSYANATIFGNHAGTVPIEHLTNDAPNAGVLGYPQWYTPPQLYAGAPFSAYTSDVLRFTFTYNGYLLTILAQDETNGNSFTQSWYVDLPGLIGGNTGYVSLNSGTGSTLNANLVSWTFTSGNVPLSTSKLSPAIPIRNGALIR